MDPLNWTAVLVGTVAAFLAGWLIYSPMLFGRAWALGSGISPEPPEKLPAGAMALQLTALFLLAIVIALTAQTDALFTAVAAILAGSALVMAQDAFSGKSGAAIIIDGAFVLLSGILMITAQAVF